MESMLQLVKWMVPGPGYTMGIWWHTHSREQPGGLSRLGAGDVNLYLTCDSGKQEDPLLGSRIFFAIELSVSGLIFGQHQRPCNSQTYDLQVTEWCPVVWIILPK